MTYLTLWRNLFSSPPAMADPNAGFSNQWSVPAILLFTKNADYENEKCLKIKVFICILHSKQKKDTLFLTSTRRYENLRNVSPFVIKSGTFLGFVFDIKWTNFLEQYLYLTYHKKARKENFSRFFSFLPFYKKSEKVDFFIFLCFDFSAGSCQGDSCQHLVDAPFFALFVDW